MPLSVIYTLEKFSEKCFSKPAVQNQQERSMYLQVELKLTSQKTVAFSDTENQFWTCCGEI